MRVLKRFKLKSDLQNFKSRYEFNGTDRYKNSFAIKCFVLSYEPLIEMQEFFSKILEKKMYVIIDFASESKSLLNEDFSRYVYFIVEDPPEFKCEAESKKWANDFCNEYRDKPIEFLELFL